MLRIFALVLNCVALLFILEAGGNFVNKLEDFLYPTSGMKEESSADGYDYDEIVDLLGLTRPRRSNIWQPLTNSAAEFLLEVYGELTENDDEAAELRQRHKRSLPKDDTNFMTRRDRDEIDKCNNIITIASRSNQNAVPVNGVEGLLHFNIQAVPTELQLVHAALRLYQLPMPNTNRQLAERNITISLYQQHEDHIVASVNSSVMYKGWLEFNVTQLLVQWLTRRQQPHALHVALQPGAVRVAASATLQPFVVGYFNGPDLMVQLQRLRIKRDVLYQQRKQRRADYYMPHQAPPPLHGIYRMPKTCERLNFTLDFKDLQMHNWVIAPKKFEAYFCGGECKFPLNSHMNATNHAIVQTLMNLKQPNLPKPCCVPTVLGSISILHYLNEDSVNLSKYPQSVAKECGCH